MDNFRILKPFLRGLPIVVAAMVVGVLIAKKYLLYVTPMYESTAKLKLADIGEGIPNNNLFKNFDVFASANKIAAEIEVLKSSELISKALDSLEFNSEVYRIGSIRSVELFNESPINIKLLNKHGSVLDKRFKLTINSPQTFIIKNFNDEKLLEGQMNQIIDFLDNKIMISLNQKLISEKRNIKIEDNYEFEFLSNEKLMDKIYKNIDIISVDKDVPVIRISYKSNIPEKATLFVNRLAQTYIYDYIESKYKAANVTVKFLNKQIEETGQKLAASENHIQEYRNTNNIINIRQETETDLRKISQLKIQQTNLKMNLQAIDELNRYINFGKDKFLMLAPNFEAFTDLLSTEIVKNIKKLQADKKDLLLTYTENDERVKVVDAKINDLVSYLIESIKNTRLNTQIKYDQITKDIEEAEKVFISVPEKEKNMTILNRDFDLVQSSYNFLNEKKIEAEIAQAAKISFHKVISPAVNADKPISPNKSIIIILSAVIAMIFSIITIYSVHALKAKVNDITAIEKNSSIPVALTTPYLKQKDENVFIKHTMALEMKNILVNGSILTFTAHNINEGKGFHVLNFCKILSNQKRKVLLVDADGALLNIVADKNSGNTILQTKYSGVDYINLANDYSKYFTFEQLKQYISAFTQCYTHVIINNGNIQTNIKALSYISLADNNLFVVDARNTSLKLITNLETLKNEYNLPNLFFILNKEGYNPNVVLEIYMFFKKHFKLFNK